MYMKIPASESLFDKVAGLQYADLLETASIKYPQAKLSNTAHFLHTHIQHYIQCNAWGCLSLKMSRIWLPLVVLQPFLTSPDPSLNL